MSQPITRAKFRCNSVTDYGTGQRNYQFTPVTGVAGEIPEDLKFHKYTPAGELKLSVDNPNVVFEPGKSYYLDFTLAEEAASV